MSWVERGKHCIHIFRSARPHNQPNENRSHPSNIFNKIGWLVSLIRFDQRLHSTLFRLCLRSKVYRRILSDNGTKNGWEARISTVFTLRLPHHCVCSRFDGSIFSLRSALAHSVWCSVPRTSFDESPFEDCIRVEWSGLEWASQVPIAFHNEWNRFRLLSVAPAGI